MEWNNEKTTSFIKDYHNLPELWNNKISDYKDSRIKNDKLKQLAGKYDCTVAVVKNKIKNLRSAFHRERKKNGKKRKWFAFELLSFLLDVEVPESTTAEKGHFGVGQNNAGAELDQLKSDDNDSWDSDVDLERLPDKVLGGKQAASSPPDTVAKKRKRLLPTVDECDVFAAHIATQLKNLTAPSCILAQQDIQAVLTRYRMTDLRLPKFVLNAINGSPDEERE